jgi:plastocyanin
VDSAAHTATESAGIFDSSIVMAGGEFSHTFADAGEFDYICIVHPWMKGKVIVG